MKKKSYCKRCGGHSTFFYLDPKATKERQKQADKSIKETGLCEQCVYDGKMLGYTK